MFPLPSSWMELKTPVSCPLSVWVSRSISAKFAPCATYVPLILDALQVVGRRRIEPIEMRAQNRQTRISDLSEGTLTINHHSHDESGTDAFRCQITPVTSVWPQATESGRDTKRTELHYMKRSAPPEASMVSPVTKPLRSEARKAARAAISSGRPKRPIGVSSAPSSLISSSSL